MERKISTKMYNRTLEKCEEVYDILKRCGNFNLAIHDLPISLIEEKVNYRSKIEEVSQPLYIEDVKGIYEIWKNEKIKTLQM